MTSLPILDPRDVLIPPDFNCCRCGASEDLIVYDLRDCAEDRDFVAICRACDAKES